MNWIKTHKTVVAIAGAVGLAGLVFVMVWFQPQAIFIDDVVNDTIPTAAPTTAANDTAETTNEDTQALADVEAATTPEAAAAEEQPKDQTVDTTTSSPPTTAAPTYPLTLAEGQFIDLDHAGTGVAKILELEDGSRILRFEDLDVDNGPDLRVILSPSPLVEDGDAYDDGSFADLGPLKGNQGNQNYEIPAELDLTEFATVAIWCRRFNVTFNAAPLDS